MKSMLLKYHKYIWAISGVVLLLSILNLYQNTVSIIYSTEDSGELKIYYTTESNESFNENKMQNVDIDNKKDSISTEKFNVWSELFVNLRIDISGMESIQLYEVSISKFGRIIQTYDSSEINELFTIKNDSVQEVEDSALTIISTGDDTYLGISDLQQDNKLLKRIIKIYILLWCVLTLLYGLIKFNRRRSFINRKNILIVTFISILILPTILAYLIQYEVDENLENSSVSEAPIFTLDTLEAFPTLYEDYYEDAIPFKQYFVELSGYIDYYLFDKSGVDRVVKGEDGWLYYYETIADYEGTNFYTDEELEASARYLSDIKQQLNEQGIEFYIMIAPNKNTIYGEYMPIQYTQSGESSASQLVAYLEENTDLSVTYPVEELEEYKEYGIYYKWDTHWNEQGGYIGFESLANAMGLEGVVQFEELEFQQSERSGGDLKTMLQIDLLGTDTSYDISYAEEINMWDLFDNSDSTYLGYGSDSENSEKILMFRDSFTSAMIPYLSKSFDESVYIWESFSWEYVEIEQPDVVVWEMVERYAYRLIP